ncbi:hypothetical protein EST38_g12105 [Candolleomyces aberdarensis]|uniref:Protein PNS1 n=1 Tax=Candolleomyces aberdarensis TaxID=2316362 RepID=A0A4Q2D381_9AGAR|nr:hypothetical protein EST38_g12105 [Candolleomyces aberdarensis]
MFFSFSTEDGSRHGVDTDLDDFDDPHLRDTIYTGRRLLRLPQEIHATSSTLTLTTHLLMANPFLLALSPVILLATLIASLPFLTLIFRLLLIGYPTTTSGGVWHVRGWANWAITGTVAVWLWSWGVSRGVMRMTTASVIGAWYFADPSLPPPPPTSTHTIHSALFRASGPSLGTIALSALILTIIRMLTLFTLFLQRLPVYLPIRIVGIVTPAIRFMVGYIDGATTALSKYALVYAGLTGDSFMGSARRSRALTAAVESNLRARERRKGFGKEPPLTLLTISPLTLTFPFALITYIFVAHTLNAPNEALGAAVLAGGVTALVGLFCVSLVQDTADTLYLCYCIDKDVGDRKREEVFIIFEPESNPSQQRTVPVPPGHGGRPNPSSPQQSRTPARQAPKGSNQPSPAQRLQGQQQRVPSQASTRAPLPQFASPQPSLPARTAPLAPPPPPLAEEDPDPFKSSFVEDEDEDPLEVTQPLHLRRDNSRSGSASIALSTSPRSIAAFKQPTFGHSSRLASDTHSAGPSSLTGRSPPSNRMMTSAELNMKSHILDPSRRSAVLSDSSDEDEDEDEDDGVDSRVHVGRQQQSGMSYAVASEMEQGLSSMQMMGSSSMGSQGASRRAEQRGQGQGGSSAMMEESEDLFPGSGFFN